MAVIAILAAITATFMLLLGGIIAISFTIKRIDKHGSLRSEAPTVVGQGIRALTGMHSARCDKSAIA